MDSFDNNLKMDHLLSVLDGDAKPSIQSIGSSRILYAECHTALKALKRDYGNPIVVSHLLVKSLLELPPIKSNDRIALRNFHPKLKIYITWLKSIGYEVPIYFKENLAKALLCLSSCNMRNEFYKVTCNLDILDGDVDLIFLEQWLEKRLKIFFNAIANIIATPRTKTDNQHQEKDRKQINAFHNSTPQSPDKSRKTTKTLLFCLCSQDHRIMDCVKFKQKTATKRKRMLKECQSEFRCCVDGCRQNTIPFYIKNLEIIKTVIQIIENNHFHKIISLTMAT